MQDHVRWTAGFLALPIASLAGRAVVGPVDSPLAALTGGAVTGLVLGAGQWLASGRRLVVPLRQAGRDASRTRDAASA
jgi:hypothetical protein